MENKKIELNRYFMPLPIKIKIGILLSMIPYGVIYHYFQHTFIGEGFIWIPIIAQYIYLRNFFTKKYHSNLSEIEIKDDEIRFPKNLFLSTQDKYILRKDIIDITAEYMKGKNGENINRVIFRDSLEKKIKINLLQTNLHELLNALEDNGYETKRGTFNINKYFLLFVLALLLLLGAYVYYIISMK